MKVEFLLPKDGVEGKLTAVDESGKKVKVAKLTWEPLFFRRDAAPVVLYGAVMDKAGNLAHKMYLTLSGSRGRLMLTDCTKPVEPAYDRRELVDAPVPEPEPVRGPEGILNVLGS